MGLKILHVVWTLSTSYVFRRKYFPYVASFDTRQIRQESSSEEISRELRLVDEHDLAVWLNLVEEDDKMAQKSPRPVNINMQLYAPSTAQVLELVKGMVETARSDAQKGLSVNGTADVQLPGITVNLGHMNLERLPEEVVDIFKEDIERLAISTNCLRTFPYNLALCARLRYLNVRGNELRAVPQAIYELKRLEVLDISKNRITTLSEHFGDLTSLKVLSLERNNIAELPFRLGELKNLVCLKLSDNPIRVPPAEVCTLALDAPPLQNEYQKEIEITKQVKRWLKAAHSRDRLQVEDKGELSESPLETPRPQPLRGAGQRQRFPVKPSIGGLESYIEGSLASPAIPPPIPARSHQRNQSRSKRMGMVTPRITDAPMPLGFSRFTQQTSPNDEVVLSSHHQRMFGSHQKTGSNSSIASNTTKFNLFEKNKILGLAKQITKGFEAVLRTMEDGCRWRGPTGVLSSHLNEAKTRCSSMRATIDQIIDMVDPQLPCYNCKEYEKYMGNLHDLVLVAIDDNEITQAAFDALIVACIDNNALDHIKYDVHSYLYQCAYLGHVIHDWSIEMADINSDPNKICVIEGDNPGDPWIVRHPKGGILHSNGDITLNGQYFGSIHDKDSTDDWETDEDDDEDMPDASTLVGSVKTPPSGESFNFVSATARRTAAVRTSNDLATDRAFEDIFLKFKESSDATKMSVPPLQRHCEQVGQATRSSNGDAATWFKLSKLCENVIEATQILDHRLGQVRVNDPHARNDPNFWNTCFAFGDRWGELIETAKKAKDILSADTRNALRPGFQSMRDGIKAINMSPWAPSRAQISGRSMTLPSSIVNPLSAALGPAAQATVPTPSYNRSVFEGNVFERAERLLQSQGRKA